MVAGEDLEQALHYTMVEHSGVIVLYGKVIWTLLLCLVFTRIYLFVKLLEIFTLTRIRHAAFKMVNGKYQTLYKKLLVNNTFLR